MCLDSEVFVARERIENEPRSPVGEWMSGVFTHTNGSFTACLLLDVKFEEFAKAISVELIFQDVENATQTDAVFSYDVGTKDKRSFVKDRLGVFEFQLKKTVLKYQVYIFCFVACLLFILFKITAR